MVAEEKLFRGRTASPDEEPLEEEDEAQPQVDEKKRELYTCPYCPETFEHNPSGNAKRMRHIRNKHKEEAREARAAKEQTARDAAIQELPPMATRLNEILMRTLKNRPALADTITQMFHRNLGNLSSNRHYFRSWLMRYGLAPDQVAQCEDEIFGLEGFGSQSPFGTGGMQNPQTVYVPTTGGGYVPVIINQPPAAPSAPGAAIPNLSVTIPGLSQPPRDEALYKELDEIRTQFGKVCDMLTEREAREANRPPQQPNMRRIPVLDEEGKVMRDNDGTILYQEIPYDPMLTAMDMMRQAVSIARASQPAAQPQVIDEDKVAQRVAEKLGVTKGESAESKELRALVDSLNKQMDQRFTQIQHERDIQDTVEKAVAPLHAEIKSLQGRSGLSDQQFYLTHRETLQANFQNFLRAMMQSAREDMRPILVQQAVASMRAAGVPDDLIQTIIKSVGVMSQPASTGVSALDAKIQDARSRWLK